jgi:hypothetical protein
MGQGDMIDEGAVGEVGNAGFVEERVVSYFAFDALPHELRFFDRFTRGSGGRIQVPDVHWTLSTGPFGRIIRFVRSPIFEV